MNELLPTEAAVLHQLDQSIKLLVALRCPTLSLSFSIENEELSPPPSHSLAFQPQRHHFAAEAK